MKNQGSLFLWAALLLVTGSATGAEWTRIYLDPARNVGYYVPKEKYAAAINTEEYFGTPPQTFLRFCNTAKAAANQSLQPGADLRLFACALRSSDTRLPGKDVEQHWFYIFSFVDQKIPTASRETLTVVMLADGTLAKAVKEDK